MIRAGVSIRGKSPYMKHMKRRDLLLGMCSLPLVLAASPLVAKGLSLDEISTYLNGLGTAKGAFTQVNPNGSRSKGTFYLSRPGRMRFEYAPPNPALVVAGSGKVAIFDKKSNAGPQQYPLIKTPLNLILRDKVDLKAAGMVRKHESDGKKTTVTVLDPKHPEYGNLKLVFTAKPVALHQWIVTDQSGNRTTVNLGSLEKNIRISTRMFDIDSMTRKDSNR